MPAMRTQRAVLLAEEEAVEGTAETLAAADGILALSAEYVRQQDLLPRDPFRTTLSQMASVSGKRTALIRSRVELKGSGSAGTPPEWQDLMTSCAMGETVVGGSSVTYEPISDGDPSATIAHQQDGIQHLIAGARGNFTLGGASGEFAVMEFEHMGVADTVTDTALLTPSYQSTVPQPLLSTTAVIHGFTAKCRSFSLDMGNVLVPRQDMSEESGHCAVFIGNRRPVGNFVVEKTLVADKDWYGDFRSGSETVIAFIIGSTAGNIVTITANKTRITNVTEQDDNGLALLSIDLELNLDTSGDDELSIALT